MGFVESFSGHNREGFVRESKQTFFNANMNQYGGAAKGHPYKDDWDVERAVTHGNDRVTWVFSAVQAIAANAARLPIRIRQESDPHAPPIADHFALPMLNRMANPYHDAYNFRFQLSSQILLSKRGAFIEVVKNRLDEPVALYLLPPQYTYPIPDPKKFLAGFQVKMPNQRERNIPAENVIWIRIPHPIDQYRGQSPLEACGLATEIDYFSRVYNRNFMVNDGRPGGILLINGEIEPDEVDELRRRFLGNTGSALGGSGRVTVMEAESAKYIDTSHVQRDSQYVESKELAKREILMAFGVPESVIGNAAERTFANADAELEVFWRETMLPHLVLIERGFDALDETQLLRVFHDTTDVAILSRDDRERAKFHIDELKNGAISVDEYRAATGREPVGVSTLYMQSNMMPVGVAEALDANGNPVSGRAPSGQPSVDLQPGPPATEIDTPPQDSGPTSVDAPTGPITPIGPGAQGPVPVVRSGIPEDMEGKSEEDALPLAEPQWGFHYGNIYVDSKKAFELKLQRAVQQARLEKSVAMQMSSFFKRQQRVVLEKWKSKKTRERLSRGADVTAASIFDISVWNEQLVADARTFLSAIVSEGFSEIPLVTGKQLDPDDEALVAAIIAGTERIKMVNDSTRRKIQEIINDVVGSYPNPAESVSEIVDEVAVKIELAFDSYSKSRAQMIAATEVGFALNEGQLIAGTRSGFQYKVWLSQRDERVRNTHNSADGSAVPINEPFSVGGHLMMHPGAPTAPPSETANCRCSMIFTNEPPASMLAQFGVPTAAGDIQTI